MVVVVDVEVDRNCHTLGLLALREADLGKIKWVVRGNKKKGKVEKKRKGM